MKEINLFILTEKGKETYTKISNIKISKQDKIILALCVKEKIVSLDPFLMINFHIRNESWALQINLLENIKAGLEKNNLVENLDYKIEVL